MSSLAENYAETIHDEWEEVYATWPVSQPVTLGDYGELEDGIFRRLGNIEQFDINEPVKTDLNDAVIEYKSSDSVTVNFITKGSVSHSGINLANAGLEMSFEGKNSFFFQAAKGKWDFFKSPFNLGTKIMALYEREDSPWQRKWVVVTNLLRAGATSVIASKGSNASVVFEAGDGDIPAIDLTDASINVSVRRESNIGLKVVAAKGMTPLLGLMKIHRKSLLGLGIIGIGSYWGPER